MPSTPPRMSGHRGACSTASRFRAVTRRQHWSTEATTDHSVMPDRSAVKRRKKRDRRQAFGEVRPCLNGHVSTGSSSAWKLGREGRGTGQAAAQSIPLPLAWRQHPASRALSLLTLGSRRGLIDQCEWHRCLPLSVARFWDASSLSAHWFDPKSAELGRLVRGHVDDLR